MYTPLKDEPESEEVEERIKDDGERIVCDVINQPQTGHVFVNYPPDVSNIDPNVAEDLLRDVDDIPDANGFVGHVTIKRDEVTGMYYYEQGSFEPGLA